jgi:hypothetical protein
LGCSGGSGLCFGSSLGCSGFSLLCGSGQYTDRCTRAAALCGVLVSKETNDCHNNDYRDCAHCSYPFKFAHMGHFSPYLLLCQIVNRSESYLDGE